MIQSIKLQALDLSTENESHQDRDSGSSYQQY